MKNYLLFLLLLAPVSLTALYNGNPSSPMLPEQGIFIGKNAFLGLKAGYEWDHVFSKSLRVTKSSNNTLDDFHSTSNLGTLTLSFNDRAELYTHLGATDTSFSTKPAPKTKVHYTTPEHFTWGLGGRAILAFWGEFFLGVEASYQTFSPHIQRITRNAESVPTHRARMHYREWQVSLAASRKIRLFIPYIGLQYTNVHSKVDHLNSLAALLPRKRFLFKNRDEFGLFLGCTLAPERILSLSAEARFINETALSLSADIRF